jgi:hypothetical protein
LGRCVLLGLPPAAWVVILTACATYIALLSGWFFAIPARRVALLHGNIAAIEATLSDDPLLRQSQERTIKQFQLRIAQTTPIDKRLIRRGVLLLVLSFLTFTAAVIVQAKTDPSVRGIEITQSRPK